MFYTWDFMHKEISVTSKMFYFMVPPVIVSFLEKLSNVQLYPSNGLWHIDDVTIDSNFDSGNLGNVEMNGDPISDEDSIDRRQGRRPG